MLSVPHDGFKECEVKTTELKFIVSGHVLAVRNDAVEKVFIMIEKPVLLEILRNRACTPLRNTHSFWKSLYFLGLIPVLHFLLIFVLSRLKIKLI